MADVVLMEDDYADVKLTPEQSKEVTPHAKPEDKWTAPANPDHQLTATPVTGGSEIDVELSFSAYQIKVRQNLLDALLALLDKEAAAITKILEGEPDEALRSAAAAIRELVSAQTRIFELTWKTQFKAEKGTYIYVTHTNDVHVDITRTGFKDQKDRMSWLIDSRVRIGGHDLKFTKAHKAGRKSFRDTLTGADVLFINAGEHRLEVISALELDCIGFMDDVGSAVDKLISAINELLGLAAQAAKHIVQWIKDTFTGNQKPTDAQIEAEKKRWREEQSARLIADIKSILVSLKDSLKTLIEEWQGDVSTYNHGVTVAAVKSAAAKRILAQLVKEAGEQKQKHDEDATYLRNELIFAEPGEVVAGGDLLTANAWDEIGLNPDEFSFRIVRRSADAGHVEDVRTVDAVLSELVSRLTDTPVSIEGSSSAVTGNGQRERETRPFERALG